MNWDAVAAIGEWVGAIAVVVSIVFLTLQVRSNTRAIRGRAAYDASTAWADVSQAIAFRGAPEGEPFADLIAGVHEDGRPLSEMNSDEMLYLGQIWRSLTYRMEAHYWLAHHGLLEQSQWEIKARWLRGMIELPAAATWWEAERASGLYSPEFIAALLSLPASEPNVAPARRGGAD